MYADKGRPGTREGVRNGGKEAFAFFPTMCTYEKREKE